MNTISKRLLIGLIALLFSACITTRVASLQTSGTEHLEIYIATKPMKKYTELAYIQADGGTFHTPKQLLNKLKKKAILEGADAIIDVKYDYQYWWPYASCVAIKYIDK